MKILPNGQVEITNGDTGEKKVVSPNELTNYGIEPLDYQNAVKVGSIGNPVKTYDTPLSNTQNVSKYYAPVTTQPAPVTPKLSTDQKKQKLLSMGYAEAEVNKALGIQVQTNNQKAPMIKQPKSIGGFAENVLKSGVSNAVGIGKGVLNILNPNLEENTLANLIRLPFDAGQALAGDKSKTNRFNAVKDIYKDRYGSWDKAGETLYNDPTGVALDASVVLGGAGALAKGAGVVSKSTRLGKIGSALGKAGEVVDPIAQTSKLVGKGLGKIGGVKTKMAEDAAARSVKGTPTELENFEKIAGKEMGSYMQKKGIYTLDDLKKQKKVVQGMYDDTVKTGQVISGEAYANKIRARASEIEKVDRSPGARKLVEDLRKEATIQEKLGNITDTQLTKTKTGEFNKAGGAVTDPSAVNLQKELGKIGLETLDDVAPGSSRIGKELQILTELEDVIKSAKYKGGTTNVLNVLKPYGTGAGIGAGIGFATGNPLAGAALGGIAGAVLDSKTGQRILSKTLGAKVPDLVKNTAKKIPINASYEIGKAGSRLSPIPPRLGTSPTGTEPPPQSAIQEDTYTDNLAQSPQDVKLGQTFATGNSPEYWNRQYQQAMQQSPPDEVTAKYALEQRDFEEKYQTTQGKTKEKSAGQKIIDNSIVSIDEMEDLYGVGTDESLSLGSNSVGLGGLFARGGRSGQKALDQDYVDRLNSYKNVTSFAAGLLNQARGAGVLNAGEYEVMLANMPNEWSSETAAKNWFDNLRRVVKKMDPVLLQQTTQQDTGLGAYPPQL